MATVKGKSAAGLAVAILGWVLLGLAGTASADDPPVTARVLYSESAHAPGGTYPLAIELTIAQGLHINSDRPSEPDLFPSKLTLTSAPGLSLGGIQWPLAQPYKPAWAAKPILVLEGKVILRATLSVAKDTRPGQHQLAGKLSYQACDDQSCLMPDDLTIPLIINVAPAGSKSQPLNPEVFKK